MKRLIVYRQFASQSKNTDGTYTDVYQDITLYVKVSTPNIKTIEAGLANVDGVNFYIPRVVLAKPNIQKDQIMFDGETYRINYARKVGDEWEINAEVLYGD